MEIEERSNTQAHEAWMVMRALHLEPMSRATLKCVRETRTNETCEGVLFTDCYQLVAADCPSAVKAIRSALFIDFSMKN